MEKIVPEETEKIAARRKVATEDHRGMGDSRQGEEEIKQHHPIRNPHTGEICRIKVHNVDLGQGGRIKTAWVIGGPRHQLPTKYKI